MLTPHGCMSLLPIEVKQKMAMFAGGASGVLCLIGGVLLLKRRRSAYACAQPLPERIS